MCGRVSAPDRFGWRVRRPATTNTVIARPKAEAISLHNTRVIILYTAEIDKGDCFVSPIGASSQ